MSGKGGSRSYVVGLPVLITVWDDGTVVYDIDTDEAGLAVLEEYEDADNERWSRTVREDVERIETDHINRRNAR